MHRWVIVCGLGWIAGCPPDEKDELNPTPETTPTTEWEYAGPCEELPADTGPRTDVPTGTEVFDENVTVADASILVVCLDTGCSQVALDASASTGDTIEWYDPNNDGIGHDSVLVLDGPVGADYPPLELAVRGIDGSCDGMEVRVQTVEYTVQTAAVPRVIITPIWITSSTTRPSGCNFVAGIGGCITDPGLDTFEVSADAGLTGSGSTSALDPYSILLDAGDAVQGFSVWSAWDYAPFDDPQNPRTGSFGTLPKALFNTGLPTSKVVVNGVTYTDYAMLGYSVNKGYTINLHETKISDLGANVAETMVSSTCSLSGKGSTSW